MSWRAVTLLPFRKQCRVGGGKFIMEVPLVTLAARMTHWDVGGIQYHPLVSFSSS